MTMPPGRGDPRVRILSDTPLFASFTEAELVRLAQTARSRSYREGEIIFMRDDPGNGLFMIQSGTVKVSIEAPDGQETLLAILRAGECLGEIAVLDGRARSARHSRWSAPRRSSWPATSSCASSTSIRTRCARSS
jgi:CRP-like cAMP-binding protein